MEDLHEKFVRHGSAAKEALRKCALMLPEIMRRGVWKQKGFPSVYEYARVFAGMSGATVDEALRILDRIHDKPALMEVAREKGLGAVRPVAVIATLETSDFWAEKAKHMGVNALETYVREVRRQRGVSPVKNEADFLHMEKILLDVRVSKELAEQLEKLRDGGSWEDLFREFLIYREKTLASEKPETVEDAARHIPAEIMKFIMRRSRGLCEFGQCRKVYAILHHTQRFALDAVHDPDQIVALCTAHERVVHMGLIEDETVIPREWRVLKVASEDDPKYFIDRLVQQYRKPR